MIFIQLPNLLVQNILIFIYQLHFAALPLVMIPKYTNVAEEIVTPVLISMSNL